MGYSDEGVSHFIYWPVFKGILANPFSTVICLFLTYK